ncbi:uncharacterized protein LOC110870041 [Helianthus annuus]|uniref:uncharacterized protein LOC110870041 n=1 Tax=Helianthus annuus TaxID=4232 RepID=UPI000B904F49|nr:uncharacterized protein LOC110870041 [Helianthus annuus]
MNFLSVNLRGMGGDLKSGWIKGIKREHGVNFMMLQETKQGSVSRSDICKFWGSGSFGSESVDSSGLSGGLLSIWDDSRFHLSESVKERNYILIRGSLVGSNSMLNVLNVYAPQSIQAKKVLWDNLLLLINSKDGMWVVGGDFNAVRSREERRNCFYKAACADNFNSFIFESGLVEYNMRGGAFTWRSDNGKKKSKLDRFLVNSEFFNSWPEAELRALPKLWSDHSPLVLSSSVVKFGARPFLFFNSWLSKEGFKEVVVDACINFPDPGGPRDVYLIKKLGVVRSKIKEWRDDMIRKEGEVVSIAKEEVEAIEEILELRELTEEEEWSLVENRKILAEVELAKSMDLKQRSRIRWAKEGDENSRFFHSHINWRRACNVIHGLDVDGQWVSKPSLVKKEVFSFFRSRFKEECSDRPSLGCPDVQKISSSDANALESPFSREEVKRAVFECGDDRAPGPDGFNFRFFKFFGSFLRRILLVLSRSFMVLAGLTWDVGLLSSRLFLKRRIP